MRAVSVALSASLVASLVTVGTAVHRDVALTGLDLSGSDTALYLGPTGMTTPSPEYGTTAEHLYLDPLGFDGNVDGDTSHEGTLNVVTTPETNQWDDSVQAGRLDLDAAVEKELATGQFDAEHPLSVFAYSQSTIDAAYAQQDIAGYEGAHSLSHDAVQFVYVGDTGSELGLLNNVNDVLVSIFGAQQAESLERFLSIEDILHVPAPVLPTEVYTLQGDGFAEFMHYVTLGTPDTIDWSGLESGLSQTHDEYLGLDPATIAAGLQDAVTHGDLTDVSLVDPTDPWTVIWDAAMNISPLFG